MFEVQSAAPKTDLSEIKVKLMLRTIFAGLKGTLILSSHKKRVACKDEVNKEILKSLFEAGSFGLDRTPHTALKLTRKGREAFKEYRKNVKRFIDKLPE